MRPDEELLGVVVHSGLVLAHSQDVVAALGRNRPGDRPAAAARHVESPARQAAQAATEILSYRPCRRCGRHGLVGGPAGPGNTGPSPSGPEAGVAPAQRRPAATPANRQRHRPLLLARCGACPLP
jgi:hypothetical protein